MRRCFACAIALLLIAVSLLVKVSHAAEEPPIAVAKIQHPGPVDFSKEVLPILRRNCLACHNATAAKAKLILETPQSIAKGGANGPVVVPGKADESLLLLAASRESKPFMPPLGNDRKAVPLTSEELGLLKLWIDQGAKGEVKADANVVWQPLPSGMNAVYAAAITPDGQYAAASRANQIFIYHGPTKRELGRLTDPALLESGLYKKPGVADFDVIQSLAFSPDGEVLASGGFRDVKLWRRPHDVHLADWTGLESAPKALALSPDRKLAATGEENGKIRLWDVAAGKPLATLEGHTAAVGGLHFSADGARLASGSLDKTVRVWDVAARKATGLLTQPAPVNAVLFVNHEKFVATGDAENKIRTWEVPTSMEVPAEPAKPIKEITQNGPVRLLVPFDKDGLMMLSTAGDNAVRLWNVIDGAEQRNFDGSTPVGSFALRPDGKVLVLVTNGGLVKVWNVPNNTQLQDLRSDFRLVMKVEDADRAVALARRHVENGKRDFDDAQAELKKVQDSIPKLTEQRNQAENEVKQKTEAAVKPVADKEEADKKFADATAALAKAEEARKAVENGDDNAKNAAQQALQQAQQQLQQAKDRVNQTREPAARAVGEKTKAERDFKQLTRAVEESAPILKRATDAVPVAEAAHKASEESLKQFEALVQPARDAAGQQFKPLRAVAISPDGRLYAIGGEDGVIRTFNTEDNAPYETFTGHKAPIASLAFTAEGDLLSIADDKSIIVWDIDPAWKLERTIGGPKSSEFVDRVTAIAFSPDGSLLATGGGEPSRSGEVKIWNASTGALVREIPDAHSDTVLGLEFSPDGKHLATAAADRFVKVFEVATGQKVRAYEGHTNQVTGVSWRADGRLLASSGAEGVIKVWDFRSGEQRISINNAGREVTSIQFFGVEDKVIGSTPDGGIRMRRTDGGEERNWGDNAVYYYLTRCSAGARYVIGAGHNGVLGIWRGQDNTPVAQFGPPEEKP